MRLLVVEDNEEMSRLLKTGLAAMDFDVDVTGTAGAASAALATTRYAAVILDLGLPDADGLSVLHKLRQRNDPTPVLILTARGGAQQRVEGLNSGADDYLAKPFAFEELVARIQALLRRPGNFLGYSLQFGNLSLDTEARQVFVGTRPWYFSSREIGVLELLMRRAGAVVSQRHVEDHLFGAEGEIGSNAVEVYVHRLRKHLAEAKATVQIHTIRGVGYVMTEKS
ncbi:MAG TPA: response regulator transcription factor [Stellaceae bacterium]|nr:response regulator transcription factor [Stellaceae bacterium]